MNPIPRLRAMASGLITAMIGASTGRHTRTLPPPVPVAPQRVLLATPPVPDTPPASARPVLPRAALVRPYLVALERRRAAETRDGVPALAGWW